MATIRVKNSIKEVLDIDDTEENVYWLRASKDRTTRKKRSKNTKSAKNDG